MNLLYTESMMIWYYYTASLNNLSILYYVYLMVLDVYWNWDFDPRNILLRFMNGLEQVGNLMLQMMFKFSFTWWARTFWKPCQLIRRYSLSAPELTYGRNCFSAWINISNFIFYRVSIIHHSRFQMFMEYSSLRLSTRN